MKKLFISLSLVTAISALPIHAIQAKVPANIINGDSSTIAPILQKTMPAVVSITTEGKISLPDIPMLKEQIDHLKQQGIPTNTDFVSLGSGVIIDANKGYIVTNAHVIAQATAIIVTLNDGRRYHAQIIGADTASDIAVLQIQAKNLTSLPLADSNTVKVGDFVAAIGSPFGLNKTVTSGIVSALHRSDLGIEGYENFIQTDASINMGNSGGALVNMQGQLIGMNTALGAAGDSSGNVGIGFAIPSNMIKSVADQLIKYGKVSRGFLGVGVETLTPELANAFGVPDTQGAVVTQIVPFSPAAKVGLKVGDIITAVNDEPITTHSEVRNIVGLERVGSTVKITLLRNGKTLTFNAKIVDPSQSTQQQKLSNPYLYGLTLQDITLEDPMEGYIKGIEVVSVADDSLAWTVGLQPGDIIVSANQKPVTNIEELEAAAIPSPNGLLLEIIRDNEATFIVVN